MDFAKIMKISMQDIEGVEQAETLYRQADEILKRLGYTPKEYEVASEMVVLRQKAIADVTLILEKYVFPDDAEEIVLTDRENIKERLTLSKDIISWQLDFFKLADPPYSWHGKVDITVKEVFELYKAELLYECHRENIPRDYRAYFERCYGLAGIFKVFVNGARVG